MKNVSTVDDWKAAEVAFRAYHAGSSASWDQLSDLGKSQWLRASNAVRAIPMQPIPGLSQVNPAPHAAAPAAPSGNYRVMNAGDA